MHERKADKKLDLATLLALYQAFSPEQDVRASLDREKLASILSGREAAQALGYASPEMMQASQESEKAKLYGDSRQQAMLSNKINAAQMSGNQAAVPGIVQQVYPDLVPPPPPPKREKKKGIFGF